MIASGYYPEWVWLATGRLSQLQPKLCGVLLGRKVALFPDAGGLGLWQGRLSGLEAVIGRRVVLSDWLEGRYGDLRAGLDLADYLVEGRLGHFKEVAR